MKYLPLVLLALIAAGCSSPPPSASQPSPASSPAGPLANGRSIFLTGRDANGVRIVAATPPLLPSCAACHGANGAGGVHFPGGEVSADLRHKALVTDMKPPYTLALVERAVATGIDSAGERLDPVMPHWRLVGRDLHDVASYVMTLK
ncbi:MAG TPA: c-type cytochrome [Candidatus Baltobacteraceae bacterium]|jgi:mono/diheme cytochrome c family protein